MRRLSADRLRSEYLMLRLTRAEVALVRAAAEVVGDKPGTFGRRAVCTAAARRLRPPAMKVGGKMVALTGATGSGE